MVLFTPITGFCTFFDVDSKIFYLAGTLRGESLTGEFLLTLYSLGVVFLSTGLLLWMRCDVGTFLLWLLRVLGLLGSGLSLLGMWTLDIF